jgi:hypothetical protein
MRIFFKPPKAATGFSDVSDLADAERTGLPVFVDFLPERRLRISPV